jgi:uncharacterized membrane protein YidH (DUF202 family)
MGLSWQGILGVIIGVLAIVGGIAAWRHPKRVMAFKPWTMEGTKAVAASLVVVGTFFVVMAFVASSSGH